MLLPEENPLQTLPLSNQYDFLAELYDSYYAYSACLMPPNMCVEAYTTTMSEGKHNMMPYDDSLPYGSSFHRQLVMSSPLPREHPSRSPSVSSDGGKVKPQYTAELDVLCRICGDRASGFHYGVHSCEGCKGFFRRTLKKQLTYRPCQMGSQCKIDQNSRNKCQYCRYQRCLNAGMSQDAVRFGRMPKAEREKLVADKEVLCNTDGKRIVELRSLSDLITAAFREIFSDTIFFQREHGQPSTSLHLDAHMMDTEDQQTIMDGMSSEEFHDRQIFGLYQELILPVMEASVKFAKKLPGFTNIPMHDQINLMKRNGFMVVQVALHSIIDREFINFFTQRGSLRLSRMSPMLCEEIKSLLERTIQCADRINSMQLQTAELALFCAILLTQESPNLLNPSLVEDLQADLIEALRIALKHNHPKQTVLLPKLLVLISDLIQIVEEFRDHLKKGLYDKSGDYSNVKPLLREIFDLS
ncbi:peroxisome proliferator-activated receptor delta-like [Haliotis rufescens]|uniref:peroxisome proliferator-activated receptor delta-like n=1 Tax=Haliotis rufescens TaxID=6454 RepID=UPI001EAFC46D|nr:peroxisome proliferator-activated receptor delta-like [Haliotis rufescens]